MATGGEAGQGGASTPPRSDWLDLNRAAWEERVPIHVESDFYDLESFVAGRSSLQPFEVDELGPVAGRSMVHLQCHFGQDSLSWARLGANVTGVDFSVRAVDAATQLAERCGLDADFRCANVYDAPQALGGRRFDVVYTGLGALVWLPDLARWARVVADLLHPGGELYLVEFHPVADIFAADALVAERDYFTVPGGEWSDVPGTYADWSARTEHNQTVEWTHPLSAVISALLEADLELRTLTEHDYTLFERWPFLERHDDGTYRLPSAAPRLPLMYSLRAVLPA